MIMTSKKAYRDRDGVQGELRIGWASSDDGTYTKRSVKWAYHDTSGKISRGAPEVSFDILLDMVLFAADQGELNTHSAKVHELREKLAAIPRDTSSA